MGLAPSPSGCPTSICAGSPGRACGDGARADGHAPVRHEDATFPRNAAHRTGNTATLFPWIFRKPPPCGPHVDNRPPGFLGGRTVTGRPPRRSIRGRPRTRDLVVPRPSLPDLAVEAGGAGPA